MNIPSPTACWSWPEALRPEGLTLRMQPANGQTFELAEMGAGDRLALCLHGFPELPLSWRHQMPLLSQRGWRVQAPALRGYGASSRPVGVANYAMDALVADVAALVDAAAPRELMILAHDWGGALAWAFAAQRVRPLHRLAVMNMPHPLLMMRELRRNPRQMARSWYIGFFQLPGVPEWSLTRKGAAAIRQAFAAGPGRPALPTAALDAYAANALRPGAMTAMLNWYRAAARDRSKQPARFPRPIGCPTLLVWGDADMALDIATTHGTESLAPDLTFHRLSGVSHWVQQDAPGEVNAALAAWLDATGG